MHELEQPFAKAAIEKNFQAVTSETNIRCKELSLKTLRLKFRHQEIGLHSCILCSANKNSEISTNQITF